MRLVLFMTRGMSLGLWNAGGTFDRELALYRSLLRRGIEVDIISWGDRSEFAFKDRIPGIGIHCNRWGLSGPWYERLLPFLHWRLLREADAIKTNQTNGAQFALRAARLYRKPLVARSGYPFSTFAIRQHGLASPQAEYALGIENEVFPVADRIVVSSEETHAALAERFPDAAKRIVVIPNYVDTGVFRSRSDPIRDIDVLFVGRLEPQKNLESLLTAVAQTDIRIAVIGEGSLGPELKSRFGDLGGRLTWQSPIPHRELPDWFNRTRLYVLPSHYEGHPKTLLEAMACGTACLASDVPGNREVVEHGTSGWLCGTDPRSIRESVRALLADDPLRSILGNTARITIEREYGLDLVVDRELATLEGARADSRK